MSNPDPSDVQDTTTDAVHSADSASEAPTKTARKKTAAKKAATKKTATRKAAAKKAPAKKAATKKTARKRVAADSDAEAQPELFGESSSKQQPVVDATAAMRVNVEPDEAASQQASAREKRINVPRKAPVAPVPESFSTDDDDMDDAKARHRNAPKEPQEDHSKPEKRESDDAGPPPREQKDREKGNRGDHRGGGGQQSKPSHSGGSGNHSQNQNQNQNQNNQQKNRPFNKKKGKGGGPNQQNFQKGGKNRKKGKPRQRGDSDFYGNQDAPEIEVGELPRYDLLKDLDAMQAAAEEASGGGEPVSYVELARLPILQLVERARSEFGLELENAPVRSRLLERIIKKAAELKRPIVAEGVLETTADGYGLIVYEHESYRIRPHNPFVSRKLIRHYGLKRGSIVTARMAPPRESDEEQEGPDETCPYVLTIDSIMGAEPEQYREVVPFEDLVPYYPTERIILETDNSVKWDNLSMRVFDLLTPIGLGQRGLIVAPPRTGKTILQQGIAHALTQNKEKAHLIILLVDERPEEVTDFRRQLPEAEVIASTFDEPPESHVHAAEMVIEKSRRMVEKGEHVVILLDSITRLARAYNALAANSGKILSGGVEANALQKPKRFFGSARNIEGGGSLTILGTALVETGSRMDEVIFEEFKGTGNMELHLDRALVDKRIFPAIALEKSGTRKEELLYHPDEMNKVYGLRRAMKGVPSTEAMEMLINRVKKTKSNVEFLMSLQR